MINELNIDLIIEQLKKIKENKYDYNISVDIGEQDSLLGYKKYTNIYIEYDKINDKEEE